MVIYYGTNIDGVDAIPDWIALDKPLMFLGLGQIGLLGPDCRILYFKNEGTVEDAHVKVVVARAAEGIRGQG